MAEVGDEVLYLPHKAHALEKSESGYPWVLGRKVWPPGIKAQMPEWMRDNCVAYQPPGLDDAGNPHPPVEVEVFHEVRRADEYLGYLKRLPPGHPDQKSLVHLAPAESWPAVVKVAHPDGKADLKITTPRGVELHVDGVPLDDSKSTHHTYHHKPAAPQEVEA